MYAQARAFSNGVDLTTLSPSELAAQALVIYIDGGRDAATLMDEMEEKDRELLQREQDDLAGIPDTTTVPEGMGSLREASLGVITPHA